MDFVESDFQEPLRWSRISKDKISSAKLMEVKEDAASSSVPSNTGAEASRGDFWDEFYESLQPGYFWGGRGFTE